MKNLMYISFINEAERPGYKKKIHSQTKAFGKMLNNAYLFIMSGHGFVLYSFNHGKEIEVERFVPKRKRINNDRNILDEFFLFFLFCKLVKKLCGKLNIDCVYIRRIVPITPMLLNLIKYVKTRKIKIIYEYPTFPWKAEMKNDALSISRKLFYLLDTLLYKRLIALPDIITYIGFYDGKDKRFYPIQNCGDSDDFILNHKWRKKTEKEPIILIGVGHIAYRHGYDIVIKEMEKYYAENPTARKVYLNLVGTIGDNLGLEKYVKDCGLDKYIHFMGFLEGKELDEEYERADIGINKIRMELEYAFDITGCTTLKTVEYTYRGFPQVAGAEFMIDGNKTDRPEFLCVMPNDKFNIEKLLSFYNELDDFLLPQKIRNYAETHMSWDVIFKGVIEKLEDVSNAKS